MSFKEQNIIIFSQMQYDSPLESTSLTIAKHLAEDNKVYYVDRPYTWRDFFAFKNTPAFHKRRPHFFSSSNSIIETENPNLKIIIAPPVPSINSLPEGRLYRFALQLNEKIVGRRLKKVIERVGVTDYIYINSYNFAFPTLHRQLKPMLTVYHCVDPLIEPYQTRHGILSEAILVKDVDMVISTSKELASKKSQLNQQSFFSPNAADISHSQRALDSSLKTADILSGIKKPIVGYFGNIERRMDYQLIKEVVASNPDKSFVFIGPIDPYYLHEEDYPFPNVYFKGAVPYEHLPAVLKGFDVAIMPFKKDDISNNIFPLKLFEYLGSGKPVVSTDFNTDLKDFTGDTVFYSKNSEEFSEALDKALKDTETLKLKRLEVAANNTWEHRTRQIKYLLEKNLQRKMALV